MAYIDLGHLFFDRCCNWRSLEATTESLPRLSICGPLKTTMAWNRFLICTLGTKGPGKRMVTCQGYRIESCSHPLMKYLSKRIAETRRIVLLHSGWSDSAESFFDWSSKWRSLTPGVWSYISASTLWPYVWSRLRYDDMLCSYRFPKSPDRCFMEWLIQS